MLKRRWKRSEIKILEEHAETSTTDELVRMLPGRSKKSINRKIEKLREEGKIGKRADSVIHRAYRQRRRGIKRVNRTSYLTPSEDIYEPIVEDDDGYEEI